ncbi:MAG TPA: PQQ-binding-like beta-propeller repeat protein [Pirellulales bacterium]|nr:PQQ-binding-like beta-propeller repeat protein [Pirellulales bacterium]
MTRLLCLALLLMPATAWAADDWPQFRGPDGQGHAPANAQPPLTWSEQENVRWKTAIPGEGWSSPVVLGRQIWMTTAVDRGHSLRAVCVDRDSGSVLHDVEVFRIEQPESVNAKNSYASPTPVIEDGRVYVHFGTNGTACLATATGSILWKNNSLKLEHKEGPGSSPILYREFLIVNCDGMDVQYVVALDKHTGRIAWKTDRTGKPADNPDWRKGYSTPLVIQVAGQTQLISSGASQVVAYDPSNGRELWKVRYKGFSVVPRPIFGDGLLFVVTDFGRPQLWAMRPGGSGNQGSGDLTDTAVAWQATRQISAAPSPLLVGEQLYLVTNRGVASSLDAKTGKSIWTERLGGDYSASPTLAGGRIYIPAEDGRTYVLEPAREYKLLATNQLDGRQMATPAFCGAAIFLRTDKHLYRIEASDRVGRK